MQENPGGSSSNAAETNRLHNKNAIVRGETLIILRTRVNRFTRLLIEIVCKTIEKCLPDESNVLRDLERPQLRSLTAVFGQTSFPGKNVVSLLS